MVNTAQPILELTDGETVIDLLNQTGILLLDWIPSLAEPKSGGFWADSPLVEGRRLAYRQMTNIIDTLSLKIRGYNQDDVIFKLQELRRLLEKGVNYWLSDSQNVPVYLRVRAPFESNVRYSTIIDYKTPHDSALFKQPFFSCSPLVDDFLLALEHSAWQDTVPGEATCVEISATQAYTGGASTVNASPAASEDDCYTRFDPSIGTGSINLPSGNLWVGRYADTDIRDLGIRFINVTVPAGATILSARIDLVSISNGAGTCIATIRGEDVDDAAAFSTYADYVGRAETGAIVTWTIPGMSVGDHCNTPDLTAIIQEIVDRGGWASGQDLAILIKHTGTPVGIDYSRGFASWNHTSYTQPVLVVVYSTTGSNTYGRAATCEGGEVFVANKHNQAALTSILRYDQSAGTYDELLGAATPFDIFENPPAHDDATYFGSTDGPFNNLVFDITTVQSSMTTVTWQYYNGATWGALTVQDNTATTDPFDKEGVHSVHWVQPGNWTAVDVNGVTAFWVRAYVDVVANPTPPQQGNRDVYTAIWPFVELQASQVGGDLPALARILATNQSDAATGSPVLHTNRLIIGSRSLSRGENYTPYLNISDEQNPSGVTVTLGANTAYSDVPATPTGRLATYTSPAAVGTTTEVTITLDNSIAPEYLGRFRAFLRYKYHTGAADAVSMRLITTPGGSGLARYSEYVFPQNNTDWQVADFGIVEIPPRAPNDDYGTITFAVSITRDTAGRVVYLYDLVLMPVDEWATDAVDKSGLAARTGAIGNGDLLDIDSVTYPRSIDQAILRQASTGRIIGYFQNRQPGPALLQTNATQRLWFFSIMYESGTELSSPISISHSIQIHKVSRYHSQRGRR